MNEHLKWGIECLENARVHFEAAGCRRTVARINHAIRAAEATLARKSAIQIIIHLFTRGHSKS